ncbi:hypothetical protein DSLASN_10880 [Desulfoluna limicola]|uniref:SMODS and SLOG-associating 2TM effector domain-containing protein n=1 Tax=Desulfoluna limicola TaxID=2810562 RepID=A0ABN6F0Q4_9BACT|nr:hypothetical protein [Desulfoluna limicola]BCS95456.1 hypothetical protein DSLASN_10880 [Desulfoluna limicola]
MTELERSMWSAMLDCEMNALYYGYIARRYERLERFFQIFIAILATSSIGSLHLWKMNVTWFQWSWIYDCLSALAIIISISLPFMRFTSIANKAISLRPIFQRFTTDYENLWLQRKSLKEPTLRSKLKDLKQQELIETNSDNKMPRDTKLLKKCQKEIIKSKNLD